VTNAFTLIRKKIATILINPITRGEGSGSDRHPSLVTRSRHPFIREEDPHWFSSCVVGSARFARGHDRQRRALRMDRHLALLVTTVLFAAFLLFKLRPAFSVRAKMPGTALRDAKEKLAAAKDDATRAEALCDAGDACARSFRPTSAVGYYLRAMRSNPASAATVDRAAAGLVKRPHSLESLLWRRLGAEPWEGDRRNAALAALGHLERLYDTTLPHRPRARALENALAALGAAKPKSSDATSP
jgi:hypothetical protein